MPLLKTLNLSKNQIARLETGISPSTFSNNVDLSNKITHIQGFEANLKLMNLNLENNCAGDSKSDSWKIWKLLILPITGYLL